MTDLEMWLKRATRWLSADSRAQVRREIEEHFHAAREAAMGEGASEADAERAALAALGDARAANRQYRRVLLTKSEARMMRTSARDVRVACKNSWLKWLLLAGAVILLAAGTRFWITGDAQSTLLVLYALSGLVLCAVPMFFAILTPERSRIYRGVKLALLLGITAYAFVDLRMSWLVLTCVSYALWMEWKRMAIRRKTPQAQWPKHLYL
ncbi:MAG TPA: hypothetical protein VG844_03330 [Terracidiphilus sp.]|nr:hypothetical protein [Terracidiphilus sp.]